MNTPLTSLKQLDAKTRASLKRRHHGFIIQLAKEIQRHHCQVSRHFNGTAFTRSRYVETALLARINELLQLDSDTPEPKPKPRQKQRKEAPRRRRISRANDAQNQVTAAAAA